MSFFRRLYATFTANLDEAISRIEDHDAVINAALDDLRDGLARSRVQLKQVRNQIEQQRQALTQTTQDVNTWTERAKRLGAEDRESALACLRRRKEADAHQQRLEQALKTNKTLEAQLLEQLNRLEKRLADVEQQRKSLAARDWSTRHSVEALLDPANDAIAIDKTLQRWEVQINRQELSTAGVHETDVFAERFNQSEEDLQLNDELNALLAQQNDAQASGVQS